MLDYTYNGVPVAQMRMLDIIACLWDGVMINSTDGLPDPEGRVRKRLEIELEIRRPRANEVMLP